MLEKRNKFPLNVYEIVLLIIIIPILFYYLEKFLWTIGETGNSRRLNWFIASLGYMLESPWNPLVPLCILGFDYLWIKAMKLWSLKILRIKIYVTLFVFIFSAAILAMWLIGNLIRGWIPS